MSIQCPECASEAVRRSKSRLFDPVISWFGYRPYRCTFCRHRLHSKGLLIQLGRYKTEPHFNQTDQSN